MSAACDVPPDVTPPLVVIARPKTGAVVERKSTVTITVTAGDDVTAITELIVFVNNESVCTLHAQPFWCDWKVPASPGKPYTLQASARDATGNTALSALVRVKSSDPASPGIMAAPKKRMKTPAVNRTPWGTPAW
jgi:hypothetical protein